MLPLLMQCIVCNHHIQKMFCSFSILMSNSFKVYPVPRCVLVDYLMLQYSGALPEADVSDLPWPPAPVHSHPGRFPAHSAHPAAPLHRHAGKHPYQAGGMQVQFFIISVSLFFFQFFLRPSKDIRYKYY